MARNAGPTGSGLLPPTGNDPDEERDDLPGADDEDELDLDGVPPVEDEDDEDDLDDSQDPAHGGQGADLAALERKLTDQFQRKFDSAVSKAVRNLERKFQDRQPHVEDPEPEDDKKPRGSGHRSPGSGDVTTIRLLARDLIAEEMEGQGRQEKTAARQVIDGVLPFVDWSKVDDQDEFVEGLVSRLSTVASDLVKAGSDRKVTQLRKAGVLQERQGQPGGSTPGVRRRPPAAEQLLKGASIAAQRFPDGKRRLGGRS